MHGCLSLTTENRTKLHRHFLVSALTFKDENLGTIFYPILDDFRTSIAFLIIPGLAVCPAGKNNKHVTMVE
jgi:hypothetical protein